jgi:hypothetical protein
MKLRSLRLEADAERETNRTLKVKPAGRIRVPIDEGPEERELARA